MAEHRSFVRFAWSVLGINLVVIMWGAFVRATGSGAGCGSHWPLCDGQVIPRAPAAETLIELSHRITSGLALIAVVTLAIWAFRSFPKGHGVRWAAGWSMAFMAVEALIGAGLVLLEYTASNVSVARAYWMAGHLINTFILLAFLALTAWWAMGHPRPALRGQGGLAWALVPGFAGMLAMGASGAVTALGDTLVLTAGISPEESPLVAQLVALRIYHPLLAFVVGGLLGITVWAALSRAQVQPSRRPSLPALARWIAALYAAQLIVGALNVALKAPVSVQMLHLFLSNLIWIALVLLSSSALAQQATRAAVPGGEPAPPLPAA